MLKIRLAQFGKRGAHIYRVVVTERRSKRDGGYIEQVGRYNPEVNPVLFELDQAKVNDWVAKGAQISEGLQRLIDEQGTTANKKSTKKSASSK